jgi:hypothetical protein
MLYLMALARENAADAFGVAPARLYRRFVAWTLPKDNACRVCTRGGHDVLPGLPPCLFPCGRRVIPPIGEPEDRRSRYTAPEKASIDPSSTLDDEPE